MAKELTHGSPARLIFFFSLPLLCGNAFQQIYSMVDTIIVGRTLGVGALAGVGATGSILFLILGFVIGMATGFSIICAQRFGARDRLGLRRSFLASLILCAFIAVVMTAGGVAAARPILVLMNTPADILGDAVSYLEITMWGVGVTLLFNILSSTITALGDSRSPLFFLIIACTLNIFLDLLFILSFGMGVGGAALATVLSQGISALLCAGFIVFKVPWLHFTSGDFRHLGRALNCRLLRTGLPMGFQTSVIAIGVIIIQAALNTLGTEAVAAFTSALRINSMGVMPLMSFGLAMATYTGQNLGAGRPDRILLGVRHGCYIALAYSCVAAAIAFLAGEPLMRVFVGQGTGERGWHGQPLSQGAGHHVLGAGPSFHFPQYPAGPRKQSCPHDSRHRRARYALHRRLLRNSGYRHHGRLHLESHGLGRLLSSPGHSLLYLAAQAHQTGRASWCIKKGLPRSNPGKAFS